MTVVRRPNPLIQFSNAAVEIVLNPTCRWVMFAGTFRFFGGYAIGYYMPSYFGAIFGKDKQTLYSILNAFVVSVGGFASSMAGGIISDRFEGDYPMIKAIICM